MRRLSFGITAGVLAALVLAVWGTWTYRLTQVNQQTAFQLEAERQRSFNNVSYHVEQIQTLLGKGLATGNVRQNMRYMSEVHHHSMSAVSNFTQLPLPAELSASTGKFLQQTGDFAQSVLRNEAAGREMDAQQRAELARLRQESANLSGRLNEVMIQYNQSGIRWAPPVQFSWATLFQGAGLQGKPPTGSQAPASLAPGGWDQIGAEMGKMPVMIYDGPFSDHLHQRAPAMTGAAVTQEEAERRMRQFMPSATAYRTVGVQEVNGTLPAYSFQLAPETEGRRADRTAAATPTYTAVAEVTRNGGYLLEILNARMIGAPVIDADRAQRIGLEYLTRIGYPNLVPTYSQVQDGAVTIAYAYKQGNVMVYSDQIKVKVALDNGEVLSVDARQYLMAHHRRTLEQPAVSEQQARGAVNGNLQIQRAQLALIPNQAGSGEILTWEFVGTLDGETWLVYINAATGQEEQILQKIETEGGTFVL